MMTKLLIGLLGAGVIATGGYAAATGLETDPVRTVSLPGATSTEDTTTTDVTTAATTTDDLNDISGPCDEAEHRNDPRCAGVSVPASAPAPGVTTADDDGPGDISGPCDEAEHRNDSRCTGDAAADNRGDDDNSGHGSGSGGGDDDNSGGGDDRSGSNSGKG
jgi:hypothetical protein